MPFSELLRKFALFSDHSAQGKNNMNKEPKVPSNFLGDYVGQKTKEDAEKEFIHPRRRITTLVRNRW